MIKLEELQNMSKDELINIISGYVSDQEIWLNQVKELEKQNDRKSAEIERLTEERDKYQEKWQTAYMNEQNLQKQVDELTEEVRRKTEVLSGTYSNFVRSEKQNAELQKQIEQLLEECVTTKKDYLHECEEHLKTVQVVKELEQQVDELKKWLGMKEHYIGLIENRLKQSVKDTAKDIWERANKDFVGFDEISLKRLKQIITDKGVEVE